MFNECTKNSDPEGFFWCSTEVDENGKHVDGKNKWGYCDIDCIEQKQQQQEQLQEQEKEHHQQGDIFWLQQVLSLQIPHQGLWYQLDNKFKYFLFLLFIFYTFNTLENLTPQNNFLSSL